MADLNCIVVTPEETTVETTVESVVLPLFDGSMGILRNHGPMIGRLGAGELRLRNGDQLDCYYLDGGFVQVADNTVSILTGRAIPVDQLDAEAVEDQLQTTLSTPATDSGQMETRDRTIQQLRAQRRVARRSAK